jgi:hypothetical protein
MQRSRLLVAPLLSLSIAACGGSAATAPPSAAVSAAPVTSAAAATASAAPTMAPSAAPSSAPSAAPAASESSGPTLPPTALDPAQLVTQSEASSLAGGPVSACVKRDVDNRKTCTYSATGIQVQVTVLQAPSQTALDAGKAVVIADLQKAAYNGIKTSRVTGIGDDAALMTVSLSTGGVSLKGVGVYAVKGLTFVSITVIGIGHAVPSASTVEAQATTTVSRIP